MKHEVNKFIVGVKDGKMTFTSDYQKKLYNHFLGKVNGRQIHMTLDTQQPKRSEQQNRFYWLYLNVIADETGHSPEEIHEWAKGKCLPNEIKELFGDKVRVKRSTTDLSKNDFSEYIMEIEKNTGVPAPDARDYIYG